MKPKEKKTRLLSRAELKSIVATHVILFALGLLMALSLSS